MDDRDETQESRRGCGCVIAVIGLIVIVALIVFGVAFEIDFDSWESNF